MFVSRFIRNQINKRFSRVPQYNWSVTERELTLIEVVSRKDKSLGDIDKYLPGLFFAMEVRKHGLGLSNNRRRF